MKIINSNNPKQSLNNVEVGVDVKIYDFTNLYGCKLGDNTKVGTFVEIQKGSTIGKNCKISSHSFLCEGVHLGNCVFIGHGVMFTNDMFPKSCNNDGSIQVDADWECLETIIEDNVSVGSNATILPGIKIGKNSLIGAGSVVTKDIPENSVVAGNPAKVIRTL